MPLLAESELSYSVPSTSRLSVQVLHDTPVILLHSFSAIRHPSFQHAYPPVVLRLIADNKSRTVNVLVKIERRHRSICTILVAQEIVTGMQVARWQFETYRSTPYPDTVLSLVPLGSRELRRGTCTASTCQGS